MVFCVIFLPKEYQVLGRHIRMGAGVGTASRFDKDTISIVFNYSPHSLKLRYLVKWNGLGKVWNFQ
jgi:hypothetical protein